jgi:hypothetical protein
MGPVATSRTFGDIPLFIGAAAVNETVTTSGTSAQGDLVASRDGTVAWIVCDTALYAATGANPTAAPGSGVYVPATTGHPIALQRGEKIALIDV